MRTSELRDIDAESLRHVSLEAQQGMNDLRDEAVRQLKALAKMVNEEIVLFERYDDKCEVSSNIGIRLHQAVEAGAQAYAYKRFARLADHFIDTQEAGVR